MTPEQTKAKKKAYYEAHKEEASARSAAYRATHKDEIVAYRKWYRETHKAKIRADQRAWYEANKDANRERDKAYRESRRETRLAVQREYAATHKVEIREGRKRHRKANKEKLKVTDRLKALKRKYGMTQDDWNSLASTQHNRCAICGRERKLVVDHCHKTGKVRGLLCASCNSALGVFNDGQLFDSASQYLENSMGEPV